MPSPPRPLAVILAELAEVRRFLHDAPPHHGAGVRTSLHARLVSLERELAAALMASSPEATADRPDRTTDAPR